jgi:hypothetical protein
MTEDRAQPAFKYGLSLIAVGVILCVGFMSVSWALGLKEGPYRYIMIFISVATSVGAPLLLMAASHYHRAGDMIAATFAFALWGVFCAAEVKSAEEWLKQNTASQEEPGTRAEKAAREAERELSFERETLKAIKARLIDERRVGKIEQLRLDQSASQKRIDELSAKANSPQAAKTQNWFFGNELYFVLLLSGVGQGLIMIVVGFKKDGHHPGASFPDRETMELARSLSGGSWLPSPVRSDPVRDCPEIRPVLLSGKVSGVLPDITPDRAPDSCPELRTEALSGQANPIEKTTPDTVRKASVRNSGQLSGALSGQPDKPRLVTVSGSAGADDRTAGQTVMLSDFEQKVSDLSRAGFSVREIMEKTGAKKWRVEGARKKAVVNTTKDRA